MLFGAVVVVGYIYRYEIGYYLLGQNNEKYPLNTI